MTNFSLCVSKILFVAQIKFPCGAFILGWEFQFWLLISGSGGIWNSKSDLGIPKIFHEKKIGKLKNIFSEKLEFRFQFWNFGNYIHRNLVS